MAIRITLLQLFVSQLGLVFDNLPEKMLVRLNQPDCQLKDYFVQVLPLSFLTYPWIIHQPAFVKSQHQPSFYLTDTEQPVVPVALPFKEYLCHLIAPYSSRITLPATDNGAIKTAELQQVAPVYQPQLQGFDLTSG